MKVAAVCGKNCINNHIKIARDMTSHKPISKSASLEIIDLGHAEYEKILKLQYNLQNKRRQGKVEDTILVVEHPPTITFGVREDINLLAVDRNALEERGIALVKTNRGGGATAHNPGQIICYPILDLQMRSLRVDEYVALLEDIGIRFLGKVGVTAKRREGFPGLWVKAFSGDDAILWRKIASIGIHLAGMVTAHGMAINIHNDLAIFNYIIPCGIDGISMTSVRQETGTEHDMGEVKRLLVECVQEHLAPGGAASEDGVDDMGRR